ncbi:DUF695 domain-containing protein, partial [Desulfovibrio sp. OttesenSCG-928-M14]|nr:DUF695 domain-containing protein [Desulfovibrio sp. OttesenSCG-928-M14]
RAGETDFYFYLRQKANFGDIVERIMAIFTHPDWESGITNDPNWEVYLDFLFPGRFEMLGIQNRRAMTRLQEMGDQPSLTRFIEHWLDFDVEADLLTVADLALEQGFTVVRTESLALRLVRPDTLEQIDDIVFSLARLAFAHGGNYLGWACPATSA